MKYLLIALTFLVSAHAWADTSARQAKVARIIEAQGLEQMFQQQLDQSRAQASELGQSLYQKMIAESGMPEGTQHQKLEQVFTRYLERCSSMFTARELVDIWAGFYGKQLTDAELDKILAYYRSPTGKKDVAAAQAAMLGFSQVMGLEMQRRLDASIGQLMAELKTALETTDPAPAAGQARP